MKQLVPFTPTNCNGPVALVSDNLPDYILQVIDNNWDKISSGLGTHYTVEEITSIHDQEMIEEYNEEYASGNAW